MTKLLLSVHVVAAILVVGPIAVAASLFPRYALRSSLDGAADDGGQVAVFLHGICRGYAVVGVTVPVFGIATGMQLGVLAEAWLLVSMVLTAAAAGLLALGILPGQRRLLRPAHAGVAVSGRSGTDEMPVATRARLLILLTGGFNVIWAVVVVLMVFRPGSTTGV